MDILILYCHNIVDFISYYHNTRKGILYGMYCNILLYCHIIRNTDLINFNTQYLDEKWLLKSALLAQK